MNCFYFGFFKMLFYDKQRTILATLTALQKGMNQ